MSGPAPSPLRICILALPETMPATLYGVYEVFALLGKAWSDITGEPSRCRPVEARIIALAAEPFASPLGTPIAPHASLAEAGEADVVIVTDLSLASDLDPRGRWPEAAAWLRGRFEAGATVASVCTGALALAEAGLLDGQEATSHWSAIEHFRRYYPQVKLRPERIFSPAGPEHRIITSGGAASWEDLTLYLISRFCGPEEAIRTAKVFVLGDRSEGQLPFAARLRPRRHDDAVIARCQAWIADNYAVENPVAAMGTHSGLSERTFTRRFRAATGYTPIEYVQTLRIEEAKQILETSDVSTDEVASLVGYEDPAFFRRLFRRMTGTTPARYRRRFRTLVRVPPRGEAGRSGHSDRPIEAACEPGDRRPRARLART